MGTGNHWTHAEICAGTWFVQHSQVIWEEWEQQGGKVCWRYVVVEDMKRGKEGNVQSPSSLRFLLWLIGTPWVKQLSHDTAILQQTGVKESSISGRSYKEMSSWIIQQSNFNISFTKLSFKRTSTFTYAQSSRILGDKMFGFFLKAFRLQSVIFQSCFAPQLLLISVESVNKFPLAANSPAVQLGQQEQEGKADERCVDSFIPDSECFIVYFLLFFRYRKDLNLGQVCWEVCWYEFPLRDV